MPPQHDHPRLHFASSLVLAGSQRALTAGFTDVWREFNAPGTGFTWPLYFEDLASGPAIPNERIDLIFARDIRALTVDEIGTKTPLASDHTGVVAMVQAGK